MNPDTNKTSRTEAVLAAALVIFVTALTYGLLLPRLGFYRDDWYMLWSGQSPDGLSAIIRLFQTDRPLIGWTYALLFKLIGANVLLWQTLALLLRIGTSLAVLWLLRMVWPEKRLETTTAAVLFAIYPGYLQQPVAATFTIDLLGLNAVFISIALTIFAIRTPNLLLRATAILAAMLLGLINLGLYEATIGLEVVRWALVWVVLQKQTTAQQKKDSAAGTHAPLRLLKSFFSPRLIRTIAPYLLMLAGYLYWRVFIFKSVRRATNIDVLLADYASNPLYSLAQIAIGYIKDLLETIVFAWFVPFYQFTADGRFNTFTSAFGVALLALTLVGLYFFFYRDQSPQKQADAPTNEDHSFLWIGLLAVLVPSAVIVLLGRNVLFSIQWDRYTTQSMLGVAILISALVFKFLPGKSRWAVLGTLLMLAVMTHYHNAVFHSRFWDYQRGVIWQLSWRAPGFQPGTTLVVSLPEGVRLAEEYEIWGPLNMAYYPGQPMQVSGQVPTDSLLLDLDAKKLDKRTVRNINVRRDYGKPLLISMPAQSSCVHVLDGQHMSLPFFESGRIKEIAKFSNIGLIDPLAAPVTPQAAVFGPEPEHLWCYYYQKIGLALQANNFNEAARLSDEAGEKNLRPADETEWVPVMVAYAATSQPEKAQAAAQEIDRDLRKYICLQQKSDAGWPQNYNPDVIQSALCAGD